MGQSKKNTPIKLGHKIDNNYEIHYFIKSPKSNKPEMKDP